MNEDGRFDERPLRVLGIGGSTRRGSRSLTLLQGALRAAEEAGATATLADVRALGLPIYDEDLAVDDYPASLADLLADTRAADAYILCSPTYHGTVSGAVKNALDALNYLENDDPPYFGGKPVALMALGGGSGANVVTALQHTARGLNGIVIPTVVVAGGNTIDDGEVRDERLRQRLRGMVDELLDVAVRLRQPEKALTAAH
jgi:FMN reductase